jgi:outer membrane protein assembly factor BamB
VIDQGRVFVGGAGIGGRSNAEFESMRWKDVAVLDANGDGRVERSEVPAGHKLVMRPELPEGHPGRLVPFPLGAMIRGIDSDKDGAVNEAEWNEGMSRFSTIDRPVLAAVNTTDGMSEEGDRMIWSHRRGIPEVPSPLLYGGRLFLVRDGGIVQCLEADSGKLVYQQRIGVAGGYSASPIAADDRIYLASQSGTLAVLDARSAKCKVLARNRIGEPITATPAIVGDHLYVRTAEHLFAFAESP